MSTTHRCPGRHGHAACPHCARYLTHGEILPAWIVSFSGTEHLFNGNARTAYLRAERPQEPRNVESSWIQRSMTMDAAESILERNTAISENY